jgi:S-DNA-T family DNA segregation ATPase FtsK/SpoIIIE
MRFLASIFVPTGNRRLNELIGFLLCVSALLLFLALASYSPLDPSLNSASALTGTHVARNWIGVVGALISDLTLQFFGIGAFLLPIFPAMLGIRWFASRKIQSPVAKSLGGIWLVVFVPALLALLPGNLRWLHVMPIEGLLGRVVGDVLIHYLNLAGAYIGRAVSLYRILVLGDPTLGSDPVCVCNGAVEPLPGLARRARQEAATERIGQAPGFETGGEDAADSVAAI